MPEGSRGPATKPREFTFSYWFEGSRYALSVVANDAEHASRKVRQMATADYDGEIFAKIKVAPNWVGRLLNRLLQ